MGERKMRGWGQDQANEGDMNKKHESLQTCNKF